MSANSQRHAVVATDILIGLREAQDDANYLAMQTLSSTEIITRAVQETDPEVYWTMLATLHQRGGATEFQLAAELVASADAQARKIAADLLGQLGWHEQTCHQQAITILKQLLTDTDAEVIAAATYALGHRKAADAISDLVKLVRHPAQIVREALTSGLSGYDDEQAITALINLSSDSSEVARNWATFALGTLSDFRSDSLNAALIARLDEENPEIRGEALVGLAKRAHPQLLRFLINELNADNINQLVLEAAELCAVECNAAAQLYPLLLQWKRDDDEIDDAFERSLNQCLAACELAIASNTQVKLN